MLVDDFCNAYSDLNVLLIRGCSLPISVIIWDKGHLALRISLSDRLWPRHWMRILDRGSYYQYSCL